MKIFNTLIKMKFGTLNITSGKNKRKNSKLIFNQGQAEIRTVII